MFNVLKSAPEQRQMIECLKPVAEMIVVLRDFYSIATSVFIHPRQSCLCVWLPRTMLIPHILRLRHFAQVPDAVVEAVAIDMVYLHRRKTTVMPSPHRPMIVQMFHFTAKPKIKTPILFFRGITKSTSHHLARPLIHELSAVVVVVVVSLDASRQCGQLAIR